MARKKIIYELMADERARSETFRKRKSSLLKKLNELMVLCNIEACAITYEKNDDMPDFWPSLGEASQLVHRFKSLPSISQTSHMMDLEGILKQSVSKFSGDFERAKKKNHAMEMDLLISKCLASQNFHNLKEMDDLKELFSHLESKIKLVSEMITITKQSESSANP